MYKAIRGYEGIYEVNELGRVRSVDRIVNGKNGSTRKCKGRELKPKMNKGGYPIVNLSKNGISKTMTVHRLVAETFVPNFDNLPQVHHKNHDKKDNRVKNLAWVTRAEQFDEHWTKSQSKAQPRTRGTRLHVIGNEIDKIFISAHEVERELGIPSNNALLVAKGKLKQAKGYKIYFAS